MKPLAAWLLLSAVLAAWPGAPWPGTSGGSGPAAARIAWPGATGGSGAPATLAGWFGAPRVAGPSEDAVFRERRFALVREIAAAGVRDSATLEAMRAVPRHEFVLPEYLPYAYENHPLPIDCGQTISQPYIVAYMTEVLRPRPGMKVLEVGTGSGYQAAVLARIGCEVYTVEIFERLATAAAERLARLGYRNVMVRHADGNFGWREAAPFDAVIVTAAAGHVPPALLEQLKPGGRMVIPVGSVFGVQNLILVEKDPARGPRTRQLLPVAFVPLLSGLR